jgi:hypothetical protein
MNVAQIQPRIDREYFIRAHSEILVPDHYVHHTYAMSGNASLAAANARNLRNTKRFVSNISCLPVGRGFLFSVSSVVNLS